MEADDDARSRQVRDRESLRTSKPGVELSLWDTTGPEIGNRAPGLELLA